MDIVAQCILLLQENGYIEKELTLRQAYDKYIHPDVLPLDDEKIWDVIDEAGLLGLFQLNSVVGQNIVKQLKPRNIEGLTNCNALMRLMGEEGEERPSDRYARLKEDISLWYEEMDAAGLSKEEQSVLEKHMLQDYGTPSSQEALMIALMDEKICGFSLAEADKARKLVAKKKMNEIPAFKEKVLSRAKSENLGKYVWKTIIAPQLGYSFSRIHGYSYSIVAYQAAYLATYFPAVYWNTAYLRVISGLDDESIETIVPIYEKEKDEMSFGTTYTDLPDRSGKIKRTSSTDYCKLAKGVGEIISHGIKVSLIDINKSGYMFEPDEENNAIIFGMKGLNGVGGEIVDKIIKSRPYTGLEDFLSKVKCSKTVVISLIKSGAFDSFSSRKTTMTKYIWEVCSPKSKITMQNFNGLREKNLIPPQLSFQNRLFFFNKCLKKNQKVKGGYRVENNYYDFFEQFFDIEYLEIHDTENCLYVKESVWKKLYDKEMKPAKEWIVNNQEEILERYNKVLFQEEWDKYAAGSISAWEMDALGFYYHDHELENIDDKKYDIVEFNTLPEVPIVDRVFKRNGIEIPIYKTYFIFGTVIAKDDTKNIVTLLTKRSGVVNVKFTRDFYARLKSQISETGVDGKKKTIETGWFKRGTILAVNGFRRNNTFVGKSYKKSAHHQCYKITDIFEDGTINMTYLRYGEGE